MIQHQYRESLQRLVTDYWTLWIRSGQQELPAWFYTVLDFMEVEGRVRFNVVSGIWEEA